jgi:hypothetical protein
LFFINSLSAVIAYGKSNIPTWFFQCHEKYVSYNSLISLGAVKSSQGICAPQAFQQEISLNHNKIEQIIAQGEQLIEKSEPLDAAVIEEELDELQRYCQEVFGRVERYHKKLIHLPVWSIRSFHC